MLKKMCLGAFQANCYIYYQEKQAIIFDPGDDAKKITRFLKEKELEPLAIFLTHGHIDHIGAINGLKINFPNVKVYIHQEDEIFLKDANINLSGSMLHQPFQFMYDYQTLKHNQETKFDGFTITCLHFSGHTPGSCMYALEPDHVLFSGDVLFEGSIGRFDLPLGSHSDTKQSLQKIKALDESYVVYPGHGDATSILKELQTNPYFKY